MVNAAEDLHEVGPHGVVGDHPHEEYHVEGVLCAFVRVFLGGHYEFVEALREEIGGVADSEVDSHVSPVEIVASVIAM